MELGKPFNVFIKESAFRITKAGAMGGKHSLHKVYYRCVGATKRFASKEFLTLK
jgi:hypothetical protein